MGEFLKNVSKGPRQAPLSVLLYGKEGIGKSTFALGAPRPIFLCEYSGTDELDAERLPHVDSWERALAAVDELRTEKHPYQTLVLDTLDWIEPLIWQAVCTTGGVKGIEDFGYGKGYVAAVDEWRKLLARLEDLRERRAMNIVLLAHAQIRTFQNPVGDNFDRWEMKLNPKACGLLREWPMAVLFAVFETYTKKDSKSAAKAKAFGDGSRIVHTQPRPQWDAKSRYHLPETMPLSWADFEAAARRRASASPEEITAEIASLLEAVDDAVKTQGKASLERCGKDPQKLAKLADWLRGKAATKAA